MRMDSPTNLATPLTLEWTLPTNLTTPFNFGMDTSNQPDSLWNGPDHPSEMRMDSPTNLTTFGMDSSTTPHFGMDSSNQPDHPSEMDSPYLTTPLN
ncbi:hypothetical protein ACOMHN_032841 [Nucella lapillus]